MPLSHSELICEKLPFCYFSFFVFNVIYILISRFHMDPSGTYVQYDAKAIGSGSEGAQQALQEHYDKVVN